MTVGMDGGRAWKVLPHMSDIIVQSRFSALYTCYLILTAVLLLFAFFFSDGETGMERLRILLRVKTRPCLAPLDSK